MASSGRVRITRKLSAAMVGTGLIVFTALLTGAPNAQAATSSASSSATPCVIVTEGECQSTDPTVTVDDDVYGGDTSSCSFTYSLSWGDETAAQQVTVKGEAQTGYYLLAEHTYHATKTQTYVITASAVSVTGGCTIESASYTFTLDVGGTAVPSGEACVFNAPVIRVGLVGHVAWGFKLPGGDWEFGANEGAGKSGVSKTWHGTGSQQSMLNTFLYGRPYDAVGYYTSVECVTVPDPKAAAAEQQVIREQAEHYILVLQDCETQTYNVLREYGVSGLPGDITFPVPNIWYEDLRTSAGFSAPEPL
jgi:hypothetical protein